METNSQLGVEKGKTGMFCILSETRPGEGLHPSTQAWQRPIGRKFSFVN
jgi:hypothetical protein